MAVRHPNKRRALSPAEKLQICFSDPVYFIETFVWAIDKTGHKCRFHLNPEQKMLLV